MQAQKQAKIVNFSGFTKTLNDQPNESTAIVSELQTTSLDGTSGLVLEAQNDTVIQLSEVVCVTLKNSNFIDQIIPLISQRVIESITPTLFKIVDDQIKPHLENLNKNNRIIDMQTDVIDTQGKTIENLQYRLQQLGVKVEEQEQYSRSTSLRFNNVKVQKKKMVTLLSQLILIALYSIYATNR